MANCLNLPKVICWNGWSAVWSNQSVEPRCKRRSGFNRMGKKSPRCGVQIIIGPTDIWKLWRHSNKSDITKNTLVHTAVWVVFSVKHVNQVRGRQGRDWFGSLFIQWGNWNYELRSPSWQDKELVFPILL